MAVDKIIDPVVTVRQLLESNWNAANTQGITPTVTHGWYNRLRDKTKLMVTVTGISEYERLATLSALGPGALFEGRLDVNAWATKDTTGGSALARKLVYQAREEISRIVRENQNSVADLLWVKVVGRRPITDDDEESVIFRYLVEVSYGWVEEIQ